MTWRRGHLLVLLLACVAPAGCDSGNEPDVEIEDIVVGDGAEANDRDIVIIDYVGMLRDGTVFDTSEEWGPLRFQLETGEIYSLPEGESGRVIPGLMAGVEGMKVGGVRRITIPPELAYGRSGVADVIPANATLLFRVELLGILEAAVGEARLSSLRKGSLLPYVHRDQYVSR